ncbi:hypothetical protein [uncultured Roseibium sp.]|uniref:hypothetical protein n=1 Tax=uncultured Roseibium sp. TaxID=1936171 RepID=UPI00262CF798|nr:hypothetical protein [uncultured Roseibium sp.]
MKWMLIASVVWLVVGGLVLVNSNGCDATNALFCLDANELGDFLAGFSAPLAFFWLAYAVRIQSRELATQQDELRLTREELRLTREVATEAKEATREQAKEARRSAEYFEIQTKLMKDEREVDIHVDASEKLKRALRVARGSLIANLGSPNLEYHIDEQEWFAANHRTLVTMISQMGESITGDDNRSQQLRSSLSRIAEVLPALNAALALEPDLGATDKAIFKAIGIQQVQDAVAHALSTASRKRLATALTNLKNPDAK